MRITIITAIIMFALSNAVWAAGFVEREFPLRDVISLLQGQEDDGWGWGDDSEKEEEKKEEDGWGDPGGEKKEDDGWGGDGWDDPPGGPGDEEQPPPPDDEEIPSRPRGPAMQKSFGLDLHLGMLLPFAAKEADYSPGFAFGLAGKIHLKGVPFPNWIRPNIDLAFTSAEEDDWSADSMLILGNVDIGIDFTKSGVFRANGFLSLGVGFESMSGEETAGTGTEDVSETNINFLGGAGLALGFAVSESFEIGLNLRLTAPLGSQNVQVFLIAGLAAVINF
jgi:hypothetical protein